MSTRHTTILRNTTSLYRPTRQIHRAFSTASRRQNADSQTNASSGASHSQGNPEEESAMQRRLSEMTEQAVLEGGRSAQRNIEQAGFSEDLKKRLQERIAATAFKSEYAAAHSIINMPESAGQGTRDIAGAAPWTGTESLHDATLRMLDSSKKPMRVPYKIPQPAPVDMRISPKPSRSPGIRIADAKERSLTYTLSQSPGISGDEREAMRREMSERFTAGARPMPVTLQGLSSLANERIEDAIARGQFNNIKRGKGVNVQADHNANSAFIDTTEYFMNKIIQKQEIVPPWIEKQQELAREVDRFRQRLRVEWRRHATRLIASEGGSLEAQMRRAQAYAAAEARLAERTKIEQAFRDTDGIASSTSADETTKNKATSDSDENQLPHFSPLRDPQYLSTERSYHELQIKHLNALTRSYNLQAPPVAQKPYLNLERELNNCYADVAPSLAEEIKRRATERASPRVPTAKSSTNKVLSTFSTAQTSRVYDEDASKGYGFKDLWRDLFSNKNER
ncbi:DnaJ family domain-containing protein [Aspergillus novofumigatus IBT 16806]|uniref:DnaJ homologue subfamily C member 28 conserved domain-containing protein n=1 Tax=Aspergillus novofumigatus (strain IBT 16806) TaxID=1392255 RepID=A0A2I1BW47_ASPN1|nr:uncharacterized protein P174DRAFT_378400 [Aspergillus novofumigatus IBT 16806]PKX89521.1 hypothetical protein P174DRAFT_378400 [Aspergillus novofumigatus IBT 16806]